MSTPTALWVALVSVVCGMLVLGAVGYKATSDRRDAVSTLDVEAARLFDDTEALYIALADADVAASTAFLLAGLEPESLRSRYDEDLRRAGQELAAINANRQLSDDDREAVARISEQLAVYADSIATARANIRAGYTVGAAYQRQALQQMQDQLLPAAQSLYTTAARQLDDAHHQGASRELQSAVVAVAVAVAVVMIVVQIYLCIRTRRWLNIGLVAATMLVVALCATTVLRLEGQRDSLLRSQREGSDPMLVLSMSRILALRSLSDENLDLIESGTVEAHRSDFDAVTSGIGDGEGESGLLSLARWHAVDEATADRLDSLIALYVEYLAGHEEIRALAADYDYAAAKDLAVGPQADASARLDAALQDETQHARSNLAEFTDQASDRVRRLPPLVVVMTGLAAACALAGLWPRIREYR